MKPTTIAAIGCMLANKEDAAKAYYKNQKDKLEKKYGVEWLNAVMSEDEMAELANARAEYYKIKDIHEDYRNHQF